MPAKPKTLDLSLRLDFPDGSRLGPGKADLLEHIARSGSISAAGREMRMSYTRAWVLVEQLNTAFSAPLVHSARGGSGGGGAQLTELGETVLAHYRGLEKALRSTGTDHLAALEALNKADKDG